jgi:hypothetical protein
MNTDAAVGKLNNSFPTAACKTLRVSHSFHRLGGYKPKTTKPDRSFATKTGHFQLLPTAKGGYERRLRNAAGIRS